MSLEVITAIWRGHYWRSTGGKSLKSTVLDLWMSFYRFLVSGNPNLALKYCSDVTIGLLLDTDSQIQKKTYKKTPVSPYSRFKCLTSSWPFILTSKWQLRPLVTSDWYSSARYGFLDTKNLWKDTNKSNTVDFIYWPPVDLQFWPLNGIYDLQWHLSSVLVPDLDSPIPKTYEKTPISPIQ